MQLRRVTAIFALALPAFMAMSMPVLAGGPGGGGAQGSVPAFDLYLSPAPTSGLPPSGVMNVTPNMLEDNSLVSNTFVSSTVEISDTLNLMGCGGVGQGDYSSALFNMPESFTNFQRDAASMLSKQLLTMNFVMPQTGALFEQLNNFGSQRYENFQRGCSLDALKQDAKNQYLNACVKRLTPDRQKIVKQTLAGATPPPTEDMIGAMAYAQAWEVCANQYVSDTTAMELRKDTNKTFAAQIRAVENVNLAIKPLLCKMPKDAAAGETDGNGCWASYLIPQARLCFDGTMWKGCTDEGGYGVKEPMVSMQRLFDTMRYIVDVEVMNNRVAPLQRAILNSRVDDVTRLQAGNDAAVAMSTATIMGLKGTSGTIAVSRVKELPDESILDYQLNYLSCKETDILNPLKQYMEKLKKQMATDKASTLTLTEMDRVAYRTFVTDTMKLEGETADQNAFASMLDVSLGCTSKQTVPLFDPNLTASLSVQCTPQDQNAFYTMAGYDLALASTRDIYRYVNLRLKQVYTRLLTETTVPSSTIPIFNASTGNITPSPTISPEINNRLALVVKETMIPYVEGQIARLDELNANRGRFNQRVQQIYAAKSGCITAQGARNAADSLLY